jgi:ribosomal protein S18 acetylase RimI-like enzyme
MQTDILAADMPMRALVDNADVQTQQLLDQVTDLSIACFGEDVVAEYSQQGKNGRMTWVWADRSNLETDTGSVSSWDSEETDPVLLGFMVTKFLQPEKGGQCLTIVYVAVAEEYRSRGIGKTLVKSAVAMAKDRKDTNRVTLSALPTAIKFYTRLGFKGFEDVLPETENAVQGQLYMEYKTVGKSKSKKR